MKKLIIKLTVILGLVIPSGVTAIEDHEQELHPNYDLTTIRPATRNQDQNGNNLDIYGFDNDGFSAPVIGMEWLDDTHEEILIQTWRGTSGPSTGNGTGDHPRDGRLWIISNVHADNRSDITGTLIADDFKDAHGVKVVDGEIYVSDIDRLVKMVDNNDDGFYETHELIGNIPAYDGWFEYAFGLVYKDDRFWIALAGHVQNSGNPNTPLGPDRSSVIAMDMNGDYEVIATGLRAPNGINVNPAGDLFVTDNQGGYRPSSMFIHVQEGKNYGYRDADQTTFPQLFQDEPVTLPAVYAVHGQIGHGPTGMAYMPTGVFEGQFFTGDIGKGGIKRYFLEKVEGEYQGAIMTFTGNMEVGIDRVLIDNDGTIFAGGVGNGGQRNQGWLGTRQGLQRLNRQNEAAKFEILALRSRNNGMELEFTQPVYNGASNAGNYSAERYQMIADTDNYTGYGSGNKQNRTNLNITDVTVSPDGLRVFLEMDNLEPGWVVEVDIDNNFQSASGDDAWFHTVWYTLNNISPTEAFDVAGCTQEGYAEYDPDATVDDGSCVTLGVSKNFTENFEWFQQQKGQFNLVLNRAGAYQVNLRAVDGTLKYSENLQGNARHNIITTGMDAGIYFLEIKSGKQVFQKQVVLR